MSDPNPFVQPVTDARLVTARPGAGIVILERVEPDVVPDYCVHGRVSCRGGCGEWCWLGDKTYEVVASGAAHPLCLQCAEKMLPADARPDRNLGDSRRADGPHA